MKRLIFLIIPACVYLAVAPLREAWGHYYYAIHSDPSYLYLFNGLNIAMLQPSAHVDNPGTTTQLFSAAVIRAMAFMRNANDVQKDVILHPELYIKAINRALFWMCLITLFLFGVIAYRYTGSLWWSFILQCAPFGSWQLMRIFLKVSPEMMIFMASMFWVLTLLRLSAKDDFRLHSLGYTLWFAFLTGFSLASKLTMIPFIIIPLVLLPLRISMNYLLLSFIFFHLLIFPAWAHYDYLIDWLVKLLRHSGLYGSGEPNVIQFAQALLSLAKLIALEHPLYIASLIATVLLAVVFKNKFLRNAQWYSVDTKILFSLLMVVAIQLLMIAKHFNPHYLIPSLLLFTAIIYFISKLFKAIDALEPGRFSWMKNIFLQSGIFIFLVFLHTVRNSVGSFPDQSLSDWIISTVHSNAPWFLSVVLIFIFIAIALKRFQSVQKSFLKISMVIVAMLYVLRHADLKGFQNRLNIEAKESQAVINTINEHYSDYTIIYGERSSSLFYALKYGANENFPQANHFIMMKKIYKEEVHFWDHFEKFKTWTEEISLSDILKQNDKVLLECDKRFTPREKLHELELTENVMLEQVYSGISGELYSIKPKIPSL